MSKSLKPRIWLHKLDIPVSFKQKVFLTYHVLTTHFRILAHRFDLVLPLNLFDTHLQKSKNVDTRDLFSIKHLGISRQ